jgi:hypothetical protein
MYGDHDTALSHLYTSPGPPDPGVGAETKVQQMQQQVIRQAAAGAHGLITVPGLQHASLDLTSTSGTDPRMQMQMRTGLTMNPAAPAAEHP